MDQLRFRTSIPALERARAALGTFIYHAAANLIGVALAIVPSLVLDVLYVRGGQVYESAWNSDLAAQAAITLGVVALFAVNWIASLYLRPLRRLVTSLGLTVVVSAVAAVPLLLLVYWFHLAIGGTE